MVPSWGIECDIEIPEFLKHLLKIKIFAIIFRCDFTQLVSGVFS